MLSFHETGLMLFTWPVLPLTLLWSYLFGMLAYYLVLLCLRAENRKQLLISGYPSVFLVSLGVDALLVFTSWGCSTLVQGLQSTGLARLVLLALMTLAGVLKWQLFARVVLLRSKSLDLRQRKVAALSMAVLSTPWLMLVPPASAYPLMGDVLMFLGRLFRFADPIGAT